MSEKFNPAPTDKHAADSKQEMRSDKKQDDELERGLKDSFPALTRWVARSLQRPRLTPSWSSWPYEAWPRGSTEDLSLFMLWALTLGLGFWIVYGVIRLDDRRRERD